MRGYLNVACHNYLLALGSNMRVQGIGPPRAVVAAACAALEDAGLVVRATSPIVASAPIGPSRRAYANAAAIVDTACEPEELLLLLQEIERAFGRRRRGQRWRARPLDCDIVLWSGGVWASADLLVPHPLFRRRAFVLGPASAIAPGWHDPVSGLTLSQLHARLTHARPLPR